jgi:myo-inositol-1(or 4)-monophosphatase
MTAPADLLPLAGAAVDLAADLLRSHQPRLVMAKGDRDMVTEVDLTIERSVRAYLAQHTPGIGFLAEEEGTSGEPAGLTWVLDPIDGTANFVHGSPLCGVSLGLIRRGRPVLGVIDLPLLNERYSAVEGGGAFAGDERIQVSTTEDIRSALVCIGDYAVGRQAARRNRLRLAVTAQLAERVQRVRMHGSAALDLAWLARGRSDAMITLSNKLWDMAAGVVIAREAGALVVDKDGSTHNRRSSATIAANPRLIEPILQLIADAESSLTI